MSLSLDGKRILVTGSTDGLGRKLALELARRCASVVVHGRNSEKVEEMFNEVKKLNPKGEHGYVVCDFNSPENVNSCFSTVKTLDALINNVGVWYEGATVEMESNRVIEMVNANLLSALLVTKQLLPILRKSEFGQVLNVSSIAGVEIPSGYFHTVYSATKFGIQAFTEALAKEYENTNLRIMGYYPGGMNTNLFVKAGQSEDTNQPWMFDPQESVDAIVFMITRSAKVNVKRVDLINHTFK